MSKTKFFMSLFGSLVLGFLLGGLTWNYMMRMSWSDRRSSDYSLDLGDVTVGMTRFEGKPVYAFESKKIPAHVVWLPDARSSVVKGRDFNLSADLRPDGSFYRSTLTHKGRVYVDIDGDGDADCRFDENLSEASREVRIDGTWYKAPNYKVTINGETFGVEWNHGYGWKRKTTTADKQK